MTAALVVFLPLVVAYAVTLQWVWDLWFLPDSYYSHGPLLPLLAAFVVWRWRARWRAVPARFDLRGWWLLGPGLLGHAVGAALTVDSLSAATLVLAVPGAVWLAVGSARARVLWPVLALTAFAVPMPLFASGRIAFELKELAVTLGLGLANALGLAGTRSGANLFVPGQSQPLVVEDPCGGLRSLLALTTLGFCFAFLLPGERGWRRLWLLVASVPLALVLNVLRIAFLCFAAKWWGVPAASTSVHDVANTCTWGVALLALVGLDRWVGAGRPTRGPA
ncbi:MAG: exosortase/archaeosortase family protein [Planctomycetota bacterium]